MKTTTIRIDDEMLGRVDGLAKALSRSRSWVINQAIDRYLPTGLFEALGKNPQFGATSIHKHSILFPPFNLSFFEHCNRRAY